MQRLVYCLLDRQQVALWCWLPRPLALKVTTLGLVVKMLADTSLAKGHLMCHTEVVNHIIVLIAEEDTGLDGLWGRRMVLLVSLVVHGLCWVHLEHVRLMVHAGLLLPSTADLAIVSYLIHIVTHSMCRVSKL